MTDATTPPVQTTDVPNKSQCTGEDWTPKCVLGIDVEDDPAFFHFSPYNSNWCASVRFDTVLGAEIMYDNTLRIFTSFKTFEVACDNFATASKGREELLKEVRAGREWMLENLVTP